jgi:alpha-tubulin suppressor-like RCC1 family protein
MSILPSPASRPCRLVHRRGLVTTVVTILVLTITSGASATTRPGAAPAPKGADASAGGTLWGWGYNDVGQIGDGTTVERNVPVEVRDLSDVIDVAGNGDNGYALTGNGLVYAWGLNSQGELGNGATSPFARVRVQVKGLSGITEVAAAGEGSTGTGYALTSTGTVWAWGYGTGGALGDGSDASSSVPVQVSGLTNVTALAGGGPIGGTAYALESNGTVWAWGVGGDGELGDGSFSSSDAPVQVQGITTAVAVAAGELGGYAVLHSGAVMAWGGARIGTFETNASALGNGSYANTDVPVSVRKVSDVTQVAATGGEAWALTSTGRVWAWGSGDLGNGTQNSARIPVLDPRLTGVKALGSDISAGFALKTNGTVWAWGSSYLGEVGNGATSAYFASPVEVHGLSNIVAVAQSAPFAIRG